MFDRIKLIIIILGVTHTYVQFPVIQTFNISKLNLQSLNLLIYEIGLYVCNPFSDSCIVIEFKKLLLHLHSYMPRIIQLYF